MSPSSPKKATVRRLLAGTFITLGAVLIFLAPETWSGLALLALGVLIELIGMSLSHRQRVHLRNFND